MSLHIPLLSEHSTTYRTFIFVHIISMLFQHMPPKIVAVFEFNIALLTLYKSWDICFDCICTFKSALRMYFFCTFHIQITSLVCPANNPPSLHSTHVHATYEHLDTFYVGTWPHICHIQIVQDFQYVWISCDSLGWPLS